MSLVEYFCNKLNERGMSEGNAPDVIYMPIVDQDLASWTSKEGDTIETVLQSLYLPTDWFNADAKRRY
ncbi:MAG: hypothetical protein QG650_347 [Patescibacteria group bacterium]|nr:hypothetical protein [Patescibacteria group bacterium]